VSAIIVVPKLSCKTTPAAGSSIYVGVGIQSDSVEFAVSQSVSQVTDSVIDLTHKFIATGHGAGSGTSEGVVAGDFPGVSGATPAVPKFGSVVFSSALINGYPFGSTSPGLQTDNLDTSSTGPLQIKTIYSTSNKEAFSTVFEHS
jgi:hypothetical protein